jgi:hypothetical protein
MIDDLLHVAIISCNTSCANALMLLPCACAAMANFSWSSVELRKLNLAENDAWVQCLFRGRP